MFVSKGTLTAIERACKRIAPLWPLKHFVAVNPFLGFADRTIGDAAAYLQRVGKTDMLMPRAHYRDQLQSGAFGQTDIAAAISQTRAELSVKEVVEALKSAAPEETGGVVSTVAEVLDRLADGDREASRTAFMIDEISKWCAAYFDEGQANWKAPWRKLPPYAAWREAMKFDRNPETMGIKGFRRTIASLPADPAAAIQHIVRILSIPEDALEDYLFRALFDIQGWAGYARYHVWNNALYGKEDDTLSDILAIRVAWGYALFAERTDIAFVNAWSCAMEAAAGLSTSTTGPGADLKVRLIAQSAYEIALQRRLLRPLYAPGPADQPTRPAFQAAFCIDVRSEIFRRGLEAAAPSSETIGFAGFFGFPIEYIPIGNTRGGAQCPVLLKPSVVVRETVQGANAAEEAHILEARRERRRLTKAWKAFKQSAVSSFTYVEAIGLSHLAKIAGDSLGFSRPAPDPNRDNLPADALKRLGPKLDAECIEGRLTGFAAEGRVDMAEAVLRAMSLTGSFARLVLLAGHGSASVNNPHASGLDCGACGGHTGEANARVAAALLNDPAVRKGLAARNIAIPEDTIFLGGLHNTTTDEVEVFNPETIPPGHADDLALLLKALKDAGATARRERAGLLGITDMESLDQHVHARSRDWSQVRPEWGLAGNAAFIAAPRSRTRNLKLDGRAFLHTYDWREDKDFSVLELIMSAPMVVASWINLQYFASSVNNQRFGSGNKTLHNVVGALGVLEGNGGDLRVGLPWQSVHDGERLIHDPVRLSVVIEAPIDALNAVIAKRKDVRDLVEHQWLHLFAIDETGGLYQYWGGLTWTSFT
jgi:uncharacterized protein YbcC (UPF0753/DUF2309 family)